MGGGTLVPTPATMKIKKYEVTDMKEALRQIKQDLGPEAVILTTRKISKTSGLGLFSKEMLEVTAAVDYEKKVIKRRDNPVPEQGKKEPQGEELTYSPRTMGQVLPRRQNKDYDEDLRKLLGHKNDESLLPREGEEPYRSKQQQAGFSGEDVAKLTEILSGMGLDKFPSILSSLGQIKKQLDEMKSALNEPANLTVDLNENLKIFYMLMTKNGVDELLAYRFLKGFEKRMPEMAGHAQLKNMIIEEFSGHIPIEEGYIIALAKKVTAFIGPTGVGKTTTIAKIAADLVLKYTKKVCLITVDNFRIGAVEQLKTYAEIVDLPLFVATSPQELEKLLRGIANEYDYILLDSTGRSPYDDVSLSDTAEYLSVIPGVMPVLVMSLAANHRELSDLYERYSAFEPEYVIFTKLDETRYFGTLANIPIKKKTRILLLATGQEVPDDMETPNGKKIAKKLLQEKPGLWNEN